jgi:acetyl esterase
MPEPAQPRTLDRLRGRAARALGALPEGALALLAGGLRQRVDGQTLDPGLRLIIALRPSRGPLALTGGTPEEARARHRREVLGVLGRSTPVGSVRDLWIPGPETPLRARLYAPPGDPSPSPLLVYFHGGGYIVGDLDTVDEAGRLLCLHGRQRVLSVAYRLAPEHPAPAGIEDACAAFRWAQAHAEALGSTPSQVSVGGDSAGATLAAVVAQRFARDRPPAAQLLVYPPADRPGRYPSHELFDGYLLTRADRARLYELYTGGTGIPAEDPRISPLRARDLSGLPPALVVTAGFDVLRDEGEAYAAALAASGTPVQVIREATLPHGFILLTPVSRTARRAVEALAVRWRQWLAGV